MSVCKPGPADTAGSVIRGYVTEHLSEGQIRVIVTPAEACARCASARGCGLGLGSAAPIQLNCEVDGALPAVGDAVAVDAGIEGSGWLLVVAAGYGLPTLGLLGGVVIGASMPAMLAGLTPDLAAACGGSLGLAGGVLAWRLLAPYVVVRSVRGPRATRVRRRREDVPVVFSS